MIEELRKELTPEEYERRLDEFLFKNSAKIQHTINWKRIIQESYKNCLPAYFIKTENEKIRAFFPFFFIKSRIFEKKMICLPFTDIGGFLGDYDKKDIEELFEILKKKDAGSIEIRLNNSLENFEKLKEILLDLGFGEDHSRQQFIIKLSSEKDIWQGFHKHTRNDIRKSEKSGLALTAINDEKELKRFFSLYSVEMRNFGTPQHSYAFFKNMFNLLKKDFVGYNCYQGKKLVASIIMLVQKDSACISFNISDKKYKQFRPNDLLYWACIKTTIKKHVKYLDLGQVEKDALQGSHAEGLFKFKEKWNGDLYDREYFFYPSRDAAQNKKEKLKKFRSAWQKIPLFITKTLGPIICSQLGV